MSVYRTVYSLQKSEYGFVLLAALVCGNLSASLRAQVSKNASTVESPTATAERGITLASQGSLQRSDADTEKSPPQDVQDKDLLHDPSNGTGTMRDGY